MKYLTQQLLLIAGIVILLTLVHTVWFEGDIGTSLIYNTVITLCCSGLIQSSLWLCAPRQFGRTSLELQERTWPSLRVTVLCLVLGSVLGVFLGIEIGDFILGQVSEYFLQLTFRQLLGAALFALIPGAAAIVYSLGNSRVANAFAATQHAQRIAAENQLRLLESQLEPHMLFNTLANLRVLIAIDANRAQAMLDHLVAFLRTTLEASRATSHPLRLEFLRTAEYLAVLQVRMGPRLHTVLDCPSELSDLAIAPLLLQPLIENAIKHGLEPKIDGGTLIVRASQEAQTLVIEVHDTGVGLQLNALENKCNAGSHFGLQQVRERLKVKYGATASLTIGTAPGMDGGTLVRLMIPIDVLG
jgi:hypothetical protein